MSDSHSLPDEIISEILFPALSVSDELFSDTTHKSPFATSSESTSAYLLVCKSWLRVATPLLYAVVVLRSKAQAKALAHVLSRNNQLGSFIKKLRVEGGYGLPMHTILKCSPNVSDLFISLEVWAADNVSGLCRGLPLMNPTRVILQETDVRNKVVEQLAEALRQMIAEKWTRLHTFDLPYSRWSQNWRSAQIIGALSSCTTLTKVLIPSVSDVVWIHFSLSACPLEVIQIKRVVRNSELVHMEFKDNPKIKLLLRYTAEKDPATELQCIPLSLNPEFIPMCTATAAVQDSIWERIFYFVMSMPQREISLNGKGLIRGSTSLLSVSKTFRRLALPFYYAHIPLRHKIIPELAAAFQRNPPMALHVRTLWGSTAIHNEGDDGPPPDYQQFLAHTSNLTRFCGWEFDYNVRFSLREAGISWDAFETMAGCAGSALREFTMPIIARKGAALTAFDHLVSLRRLDWKTHTSFECDAETPYPDGLPNLMELRIARLHPSFLTALSSMKLPSLRRLVLSNNVALANDHEYRGVPVNVPELDAFLSIHGSSLTDIDLLHPTLAVLKRNLFDVCPNLLRVALRVHYSRDQEDVPDAAYFSSPTIQCSSLTKIYINLEFCQTKERIAHWDAFLAAFTPDRLPQLREIQFKCCRWPTTEREISKSCWVRWAERLVKHNVDVTNEMGEKWRPRLKL